MNKSALRGLLAAAGFPAVATTADAARLLNLSARTLNKAKNSGALRYIERNTITFDAIVDWLYANPHFQTKLNRR